jgi:hypothetical protein
VAVRLDTSAEGAAAVGGGAPAAAPVAPAGALRDLSLHVYGGGLRAAGAWVRACCARVPGGVRIALHLHDDGAGMARLAAAAIPGVGDRPQPPVAVALRFAAGALNVAAVASALITVMQIIRDPAAVETLTVVQDGAGLQTWTPSDAGFVAALRRARATERDLAGLRALYAAQRLSFELPGPLCAELAHLTGEDNA